MTIGLLIILAIPSAVLYFRFDSARNDIILQGIVVLALLFFGWRVLKLGGCVLRLIGLAMMILGVAAYYYLIIQPFFTGQITILGLLR